MYDFKVEFLTTNCKKIYQKKKHVILGISPFTSKYNEKYIRKIIQWANNNFDEFTILLGGEESKNILECLGYSTTVNSGLKMSFYGGLKMSFFSGLRMTYV